MGRKTLELVRTILIATFATTIVSLAQATPPPETTATVTKSEQANCVLIKALDVIGSRQRSYWLKQFAVIQKFPRCIDSDRIKAIVNAANSIVLDNGYITTQLGLQTPQDLARSKVLTLSINDGLIARVDYVDAQGNMLVGATARSLQFMLHDLNGQLLNIHQIDDRIEKINQLKQHKVSIEIIPDTKQGFSILKVIYIPRQLVTASLNYSHGLLKGSNDTLTGAFGVGNLLGITDKWDFSRIVKIPHEHRHYDQTNTFNFSLPWRSHLYQLSYSDTQNGSTLFANNTLIFNEKRTQQGSIGWQMTLNRNARYRIYGFSSVALRANEVWINQTLSDVSSHKNAAWEIGIKGNHFYGTHTLNWQGLARFGQDWFDSDDDADADGDSPRNLFHRYNGSIEWQSVITNALLAGIFSAELEIQHSNQVLLAHERLSYPYDSTNNDDKGMILQSYYLWNVGKIGAKLLQLKGYSNRILSGLTYKLIAAGIVHQRNTRNAKVAEDYHIRNEISYSFASKWLQLGVVKAADTGDPNSEKEQSLSAFIKVTY